MLINLVMLIFYHFGLQFCPFIGVVDPVCRVWISGFFNFLILACVGKVQEMDDRRTAERNWVLIAGYVAGAHFIYLTAEQ